MSKKGIKHAKNPCFSKKKLEKVYISEYNYT